MKSALTIKYGGALVDADDCNEESYLKLGLVCPCCYRPVFWVRQQERMSKNLKQFIVSSHFSHPKAVSSEEAAACAERVSRISPKEKKQIEEKAKRQRLRLLETWFWQILDSHWFYTKTTTDFDATKFFLLGATGDEIFFPTHNMLVIINGFSKNLEVVFDAAEFAFAYFESLPNEKFNANLFKKPDAYINDIWRNFGALAKEPLHKAITKEAIRFLGAKTNKHFVRAFLMSFFIGCNFLSDDLLDLYGKVGLKQSALIVYRLIGTVFALIPWADEFERLSNCTELPPAEFSSVGIGLRAFFKEFKELGQELNQEHPGTPQSICDLFLKGESQELKGLDFERIVEPTALERAINQMQHDGLKLCKEAKALRTRPKKLGFA